MFIIHNRADLEQVCGKRPEIIIYGAGLVAHVMAQYLLKHSYGERICSVVVKSREQNPEEILGIPVIQLDELTEQQVDAVFLIATLENLHEEIAKELEACDCKEVAAVSNDFYYTVKREQSDFTGDILFRQKEWSNRMQLELFQNLRQELCYNLRQELLYNREMGEVRAVHDKTFSQFMGIHKGRDIVIVATGPSLQKYKPIPDAIHIGVNTAYKASSITFDYFFVQDYSGKSIQTVEDIKNTPFIKFFGKYMECSDFEQLAEGIEIPEQKALEAGAMRYYLDWPMGSPIHRDIRYAPLMHYYSVVFPAIQFALYCNPGKIYLVGCDCSQKGHFNGDKQDCLPVEGLLQGYNELKKFAEKHYPETEIISINPVGLKGYFKDIYTE